MYKWEDLMKKVCKVLALSLCLSIFLLGCNEDEKEAENENQTTESTEIQDFGDYVYEPFSSDIFELDYRPEVPELDFVPGKVSFVSSTTDSKNSSVIPGVRPLSEYKIKYGTSRSELQSLNPVSEKVEYTSVLSDDTPLSVVDWGPQQMVPGEVVNPRFYVLFSSSVAELSAIDSQTVSGESIFTITPRVKGTYRWTSTKELAFDVSEPLVPNQKYTITVSDSAKSISGNGITGNTVFTTSVAPLLIKDVDPGVSAAQSYYYYNTREGISTELGKNAKILLNSLISPENLLSLLSVTEGETGRKLRFSITGEFSDNRYGVSVSSDKTRTNTIYITIADTLKINSTIHISIPSANSSMSYYTTKPLIAEETSYSSPYGLNKKVVHPFTIEFLHPIDSSTALNAINIPGYTLTEENVFVTKESVTIGNLPVKAGDSYEVSVNTTLKDIYGQKLSKAVSYTVKVSNFSGYANFADSGIKMLEAQFPHKFLFEYMNNVAGSAYQVQIIKNPLYSTYKNNWNKNNSDAVTLPVSQKNVRLFEEVDLDPYLIDGKGFLRFDADVMVSQLRYDGSMRDTSIKNNTTIQVTDLGITLRYGINKAIIVVRSLSTNKPVENAEVWMYQKNISSDSENSVSNVTPSVFTDADGIAVLPLLDQRSLFPVDRYGSEKVAVYVKTDTDKATFTPDTHSAWQSGVSTLSPSIATRSVSRTFLFCDRGVYKPGETITYRGIDKNQSTGLFSPYTGKYSISLTNYSWDNSITYETTSGTTTSSGGFWGSFTLPEDLEPGSYLLSYKRQNEEDRYTQRLFFNVAYFEGLKIQSEITIPSKLYYTGDTLSASVQASYLAGGSLGGASYSSYWYTEPTPFRPEDNTLKGYRFGPEDTYSSRRQVSGMSGVLSATGTADIVCKTQLGSIVGIPYTYRSEVYVTDESNQKIAATANTLVHSSLFYLGVGKPSGIKGFAKQGDTLSFPYVLVSPEGKKQTSLSSAGVASGTEIQVELIRETWTLVQQNSVEEGVYSRYTKVLDTEIKISQGIATSGTVTVTPKNAGWYTLRLTTTDEKKNSVITEYGFYATGSNATWRSSDNASSLRLTPDQSIYNPGDTAQVLLESSLPSGDYLITVEREGIFTHEVRHFDTACNVIDIPIARNYVPVVYVSVSSYSKREGMPTHEYGEKDLGKPSGYFGVTPLFVNPMVKAFSVEVETDKKAYRPGDMATITLKATKAGKPLAGAEITVMAVDRAVLDLINYHVPNPIDFFYNSQNFPLCVAGGDSRDYLMDPITYSIKSLQGGDSDEEKEEDERKDFRPTALFEPALITGEDGTVSCSFKIPDNLTTFRITAIGLKDELLAIQEDEFAVRNPINVQAVQPRRLRERDTAECGVLVTNLTESVQDITVSLSIRSPETNKTAETKQGLITQAGNAFIDGNTSNKITLGAGNSGVVYFDVGAEKQGTVELVYAISSGPLSEKLVSSIKIEKSYVLETVVTTGSTGDLEQASAEELVVLPSFAEEGVGNISVTLDATRLGNLSSAVKYVFRYPYGCIEQQTAQVLPLIVFEDYIDVFGLQSEIADTKKFVMSFMKSWENYQKKDGGFPYWAAGMESNYYVSLRMAHLYLIAQAHGYSNSDFPIDFSALLNFINSKFDTNTSSYLQAYTYYVFSLAGDKRLDNNLEKAMEKQNKTHSETALLGLAWAAKNTEKGKAKALECANGIRSYLTSYGRGVDITRSSGTLNRYYFYTSDVDEKALILQLFATTNPTDSMVDKLLYSLLSEMKAGYWINTVATTRALESIYTFIKGRNLDSVDFIADASFANNEIVRGKFTGVAAKEASNTLSFSDKPLKDLPRDTKLPLTFTKIGKGTLYYTTQLQYAIPDEMQIARDMGFSVKNVIVDVETGLEVPTSEKGVLIRTLESGKTYKAVITINAARDSTFVALRAPIPSGAEILDSTFVSTGSEAKTDYTTGRYWERYLSNQVNYDNESRFFWDSYAKGESRVSFTFRAARRGIYPVTPTQVECMYEPEDFGRSDGYLYIIK